MDWKCRQCGSRIPNETLLRLIAEGMHDVHLKIADSEGDV
jgi:hypothetical protein